MANYALCITATKGGGSFPVFKFKASSGTPTVPITINSIVCDGFSESSPPCLTSIASMQNMAGTSFTPTTSDYSLSPVIKYGTWSSVNSVTIYNLIINGTPITSNGFVLTNVTDTITIFFSQCQAENTYYCLSPTPVITQTQTQTPSYTPTNTPNLSPSYTPSNTPTITKTPTNTPTTTPTPSVTQIYCVSGITTGSHYYTDCCGNFITGTNVGTTILFNPQKPSNGVNSLGTPSTTVCSTPTQTPSQTQTPTVSLSPTNTPTPTKTPASTPTATPTPQPTPVYAAQNTCDIFTLFDLGVECLILSQPTDSTSTDGVLGLTITGGTNPYTIYWSDSASKEKTRFGLKQGSYSATVVDFYGDYTASTVCTLQAPPPSPSQTPTNTPTPTKVPVYGSLCVLITGVSPVISPIQFTFNGIVNNYPVWISGSYTLSWNMNNKRWEIQGLKVGNGLLVSTTTNIPPLSNWTIVGGNITPIPNVNVTQGTCPAYTPFDAVFNKQDSICGSSGSSGVSGTGGSITITTSGGVPPYIYSKDGGSTFTTSNIFNSLPVGSYNVIAQDSLNNLAQKTIQINSTGAGTTYDLSISNYNLTTVNNGFIIAQWKVNVNPPIPVGTYVTFEIAIETIQQVNGPGSGTTTSSSQVFSGTTSLSPISTTSNSQTTTRNNCSPEQTITNTIVEKYSVTMTNGSVVSGTSNSTLTITSGETSGNGCVTNLTQNIKVKPQAATPSGCQCCTINTNLSSAGGITRHSISYGQGLNTQIYYSFIIGTGTTQNGACENAQLNISRRINSSTFAPQVTVFAGNPTNPSPLLGSSFCVYNGNLYYMNPNTGLVTGPVLDTGGLIQGC